jgi:hypothetical protein
MGASSLQQMLETAPRGFSTTLSYPSDLNLVAEEATQSALAVQSILLKT